MCHETSTFEESIEIETENVLNRIHKLLKCRYLLIFISTVGFPWTFVKTLLISSSILNSFLIVIPSNLSVFWFPYFVFNYISPEMVIFITIKVKFTRIHFHTIIFKSLKAILDCCFSHSSRFGFCCKHKVLCHIQHCRDYNIEN